MPSTPKGAGIGGGQSRFCRRIQGYIVIDGNLLDVKSVPQASAGNNRQR
jgi:hypothetical protein